MISSLGGIFEVSRTQIKILGQSWSVIQCNLIQDIWLADKEAWKHSTSSSKWILWQCSFILRKRKMVIVWHPTDPSQAANPALYLRLAYIMQFWAVVAPIVLTKESWSYFCYPNGFKPSWKTFSSSVLCTPHCLISCPLRLGSVNSVGFKLILFLVG